MSTNPRGNPVSLSELTVTLHSNGLDLLGFFNFKEDEYPFPDRHRQPRSLALVGNIGSAIWPVFDDARQHHADLTLDGWTEDVVGRIAEEIGLDAVYPFKGPPYHPFIQWAKRSGTLFASPIGLTIHSDYGLWVAFRAALLVDHVLDQPLSTAQHPCESCQDRPCLSACPVQAFDGEAYDFAACLDHVATASNACRGNGCLARIACPVGQAHRYQAPHANFHMEQLIKAHGKA